MSGSGLVSLHEWKNFAQFSALGTPQYGFYGIGLCRFCLRNTPLTLISPAMNHECLCPGLCALRKLSATFAEFRTTNPNKARNSREKIDQNARID